MIGNQLLLSWKDREEDYYWIGDNSYYDLSQL